MDVRSLEMDPAEVINPNLPTELSAMKVQMCEYGVIRLNQTCHMTYDKHQYTRVKTNAGSHTGMGGEVQRGGHPVPRLK